MTSTARQFQVSVCPTLRLGDIVRLEGSPVVYRVKAFEGGAVKLAHPSGKPAGWWPHHVVQPMREERQ